jgi:hypothetical protein
MIVLRGAMYHSFDRLVFDESAGEIDDCAENAIPTWFPHNKKGLLFCNNMLSPDGE